ncbi:MAG: hypothetical protein ACL93V_15220 [Candidatus Electrothrix sp. YB6]
MRSGQQFSFLVSPDTAKRMDRVVQINDGRVLQKQRQGNDVVLYTVERT